MKTPNNSDSGQIIHTLVYALVLALLSALTITVVVVYHNSEKMIDNAVAARFEELSKRRGEHAKHEAEFAEKHGVTIAEYIVQSRELAEEALRLLREKGTL